MKGDEKLAKKKDICCGELSSVLSSPRIITEVTGETLSGHLKWYKTSDIEDDIVIIIRDLSIGIYNKYGESVADNEVEIRYGFSKVNVELQFINCDFYVENIWQTGIRFAPRFIESDYSESFTFISNTGECEFSFLDDSSVYFGSNEFIRLMIKRHISEKAANIKGIKGISIVFSFNRIMKLELDFDFPILYPIRCRFFGKNEITMFCWNRMLELEGFAPRERFNNEYQIQDLLHISFSRTDRIGNGLLKLSPKELKGGGSLLRDMKELFVKFKKLASLKEDIGQITILNSFVLLVEFVLVKNDEWYKTRQGWQDWLLLEWRYMSSRFYTSWTRPTIGLIASYFTINSIPFLILCFGGLSFDWPSYLAFCFHNPTKIPFYTEGLEAVLGRDRYGEMLWAIGETWLAVFGIIRLIGITLFGYAFKNAIASYRSL